METIDPSYCMGRGEGGGHSFELHLGKAERRAMLPEIIPKNKKKLKL